MQRSQGVQNHHAGPLTRILFWFAKRRLGKVHLGARIRAFDPRFLLNAARLDLYAASQGVVPKQLKGLAQLKTAIMVGCPL
jgi:hypothetical protein